MRQMSNSNTQPYRSKKEKKMNTYRKAAIIVGVLYILGTVAGFLSRVFTGSILSDPNYLIKVSENQNQIVIGVLLVLFMGLALAMMSVMLFPILKKHNEALALGYVVFRALEAVIGIAILIGWLLLLTVSQEYVKAGAPVASHFQTLGALLLKATTVQTGSIMDIVFPLGALMLYSVFYQSKLIPRWISVWGLVGAIIYLASGLLVMFGSITSTISDVLQLPIFLQEIVLAVLLIVKGFNPSAITSLSAKTE
jgi:Domain of unknown function (DUF4386)